MVVVAAVACRVDVGERDVRSRADAATLKADLSERRQQLQRWVALCVWRPSLSRSPSGTQPNFERVGSSKCSLAVVSQFSLLLPCTLYVC